MAQHTKDLLAYELRKIGLEEMAQKAEQGLYHDYLSPLALPCLQLNLDLIDASIAGNKHANELRMRHLNGEFDADKKESDDWANSPEGRQAFENLRAKFQK